jgi:hypothetical protein
MSSYYGVVFPEFWTGETGRVIQASGGKDAQLTALYLMSCRYATMIGLYPLPVRDIRHETGIGQKGLVRAFTVLSSARFADYDARTEHVWVREMAKFRLGLQVKALESKDNRVLGIQRLYDRLTENPFLEPFFDRYAKELHLRGKRRSGRPAEPLLDMVPCKGLRSPLQASDQDQSTGIRDQVQGSEIRDQRTGNREDLPPLSRRPVKNLSKIQTPEDGHAIPATKTRGVAAALRDRTRPARTGSSQRRRGMESADPRPLGPIGFHGTGSADAGPSDVGRGAGVREAPRSAAVAGGESGATQADRRTVERSRSTGVQGEPGSARTPGDAASDGRPEQFATESDVRTDPRLASGAVAESASGGAAVGENAERLGETPGQAELRRTIERLRRGQA